MRERNKTSPSDRFKPGERVTCFRRGEWWWCEYYLNRKQKRQPLKTTSKKEARRRAIRLEASLLDGSYRQAPPNKTVAEVIELHERHLKTEDRAPGTIKRYIPESARWRTFLEDNGVTRINDVGIAIVEKYRAQRKAEVAPTTLYHETILIKQVVNFAFERGFLDSNPLKKLKLKRPRPAPQPTFTLDQVNRIIAAGGIFADVFEFAAFTGARVGEIRWLTWDDVELDVDGKGGFIHVRAKPGEWKPKDGDDRKTPLHPRVAAILVRRPRDHRFVFTARPSKRYRHGGHQISDRHVLASLKRVLKRLGIARGTVHAFRRFFISFCANNGVEPFQLMRWVGHSDISMVLRYYNLGDDESLRAMAGVPFCGPGDAPETDPKQGQNKDNRNVRKAG
jgi:integrase